MSNWTYVSGCIKVEPMGRTQHEKRYILETVLDHLPTVSGSEKDMKVYVIQKSGYNSVSSHNEFGEDMKYRNDHTIEMQDTYILVVEGALRDREFNETFHEFIRWLCRLSKRIEVCDILVKISSYGKQYIISDYEAYYDMYERPSWCKGSNGKPAWAEYLMFDIVKAQKAHRLTYKGCDNFT